MTMFMPVTYKKYPELNRSYYEIGLFSHIHPACPG
jgi:hypothetical protein